MKLKLFIFCILFIFSCSIAYSQNNIQTTSAGDLNVEVRAGVIIGGISPIPLPVEIREINTYSPEFNAMIETQITKWFTNKVGVSTSLRFENKGMETSSRVKGYGTKIVQDGNEVGGYWTGNVFSLAKISYLTVPLLLNMQLHERWRMQVGGYYSYNMTGKFVGKVYDGYFRNGTPVGEKIVFENDQYAAYDFSDELRKSAYGIQLSGQWQARNNFYALLQFTWGISNVFKKDFDAISFNMFPIYISVGASYQF